MTAVLGGILTGLFIDWSLTNAYTATVYANDDVEEPQEVKIRVVIDWSRERIIEEIRNTFPEDPDTAVRIAKCESGLVADIQSQHILSYGQERSFGVMQVHEPVWKHHADRLGLPNWRTDPGENLKLARFIYESAGKRWTPWSCYTKKMI